MPKNDHPLLALIGYGKLGREIDRIAGAHGFSVGTIIDPFVEGKEREITAQNLAGIDVCIEISHPKAALTNIRRCAELGKNIVVGVTGWYEHMDEVRAMVRDAHIGCIHANNFLLGVHAFARLVSFAGTVFQSQPGFDAAIHETHHAGKADAPSGTALMLGRSLLSTLTRKKGLTSGVAPVPERSANIQITSTRVGDVPGVHTIIFDSGSESVELTHTLRSRTALAEGALAAAAWIHHKSGFYSMEDMINESQSV